MFECGMAWLVLRDPPNHDASASHCRSLVYVVVRGQYFYFQPCILLLTVTKRASSLGMKAALGNIKCSTHERNRIASSHRLNQTVSHRDSLAKYVAGDSTGHCNTAEIFCAGDKKFNIFLGRSFNSSVIISSCSCE